MSLIHHSLISEAFDTFNIPVGNALKVNEDGTFKIDAEADDFQRVMSALVGQIVADHVTAGMVLPSNVNRLKNIARDIEGILTYRGMMADDREEVEEVIDTLNGVIENLDGCMRPAR